MVEKQNNFRILLVDDEYSWFKEFSESLVEFPDCPVSLKYRQLLRTYEIYIAC